MHIQVKAFSEQVFRNLQEDYAHRDDAGLDIRALVTSDLRVPPKSMARIPTGIALYPMPVSGRVVGLLLPRSGLASKSIYLANAIGVIDQGYQGEIEVLIKNDSDNEITITNGMKIAQLVFVPVLHPEFRPVERFSTTTDRGESGFGSSGD